MPDSSDEPEVIPPGRKNKRAIKPLLDPSLLEEDENNQNSDKVVLGQSFQIQRLVDNLVENAKQFNSFDLAERKQQSSITESLEKEPRFANVCNGKRRSFHDSRAGYQVAD